MNTWTEEGYSGATVQWVKLATPNKNENENVLVTGRTGSGKTEYVIRKAGEMVKDHHPVYHVVPLVTLKNNVLSRYKEKFPDEIRKDIGFKPGIHVLTYHEFNQLLVLKNAKGTSMFNSIVIFDEFHVINEEFFKSPVYSAIQNTGTTFRTYFVSATPINLPNIRFHYHVKVSSPHESKYTIKQIPINRADDLIIENVIQGKIGFVYEGSIKRTINTALRYSEMLPPVENEDMNFDTDDDTLQITLKKGVAYMSSSLTLKDRNLVTKLMEDNSVKLLITTTSINYGVDFKFDFAVFKSDLYMDKMRTEQFHGRVGRRGEGVIYVLQGLDLMKEPKPLTIGEDDNDFANLIGLKQEIICKKYPDICPWYQVKQEKKSKEVQELTSRVKPLTEFMEEGDDTVDMDQLTWNNGKPEIDPTLKSIAYHLIRPKDAVKIVNLDIHMIEDDNYLTCITASIYKMSVNVNGECVNMFGINADDYLVTLMNSWMNLEKKKLNGTEYKEIQNLSYLAHIIGILRDERFEQLSVALKYGVRMSDLQKIQSLLDIPYIGRMRAYELYKEGITKENLCMNREKVIEKLKGIGKRVLDVVCG